MKNRPARAIGLLAILLPLAAQAGSAPASDSSVAERQLHHTQAELQRQREQTGHLRTRVNDLEHGSAAKRAQLDQRDREIAELKRKLDALSPAGPIPAPAGSH